MEVKLVQVNNFGRWEFRPGNDLARTISKWLKKKHLSKSDKEYIEKIGLKPVVLNYYDEED